MSKIIQVPFKQVWTNQKQHFSVNVDWLYCDFCKHIRHSIVIMFNLSPQHERSIQFILVGNVPLGMQPEEAPIINPTDNWYKPIRKIFGDNFNQVAFYFKIDSETEYAIPSEPVIRRRFVRRNRNNETNYGVASNLTQYNRTEFDIMYQHIERAFGFDSLNQHIERAFGLRGSGGRL